VPWEEIDAEGKKTIRQVLLTVNKLENDQVLESRWRLPDASTVELRDTTLQFIPFKNAFIGMGFLSINTGFSAPLFATGDAPRKVGDEWSIATNYVKGEDVVKNARQFKFAGTSGDEGARVARIESAPSSFKLVDPKILEDNTIEIMTMTLIASMGAEVNGTISGEYTYDLHQAAVTHVREHFECDLTLTLELPPGVQDVVKALLGSNVKGKLVVEIEDRLISKAESDALQSEYAAKAEIEKSRAVWLERQKSDDPYMKTMADSMLQILDRAAAAPEPPKTGDF
jgi:hypothetical protein